MKKSRIRASRIFLLCSLVLLFSSNVRSEVVKESIKKDSPDGVNFAELPIDTLVNVEVVTSASKYLQKLIESPSAVTVITKEDIEHSGALDIVQLFRFTPGVLVVEEDSNTPEVYLRGLPQSFGGRLLVLIDGVPYYFSGAADIKWRWLPISLPNVERIEIIRGASSTLYGANAFSGVINIVSKKVGNERSIDVRASVGNLLTTQEEVSWNQPISDKVRFRLSGLFRHDNGYGARNGDSQPDKQLVGQGMFNFEADFSERTHLKLYSYFKTRRATNEMVFQQPTLQSRGISSGFQLDHDFGKGRMISWNANYQYYHEVQKLAGVVDASSSPLDDHDTSTSLQYVHKFNDRDTLVTGSSYRHAKVRYGAFFTPPARHINWASFFINNDFKILKNLILTTGGRYEFDTITRSQLSGRANLTYLPTENHAIRASVSRAVRTPSLNEAFRQQALPDICCPYFLPIPNTNPGDVGGVIDIFGGKLTPKGIGPESVLAVELGYQGQWLDKKLQSNAQFYFNNVKNLIYIDFDPSSVSLIPTPTGVASWNNRTGAKVYGFELDLNYQPFDWWKTGVSYTYTRQMGEFPPNFLNATMGRFPHHLVSVRNRFTPGKGVSLDLLFNYTGPYQFFDVQVGSNRVNRFFRLDARVAKKFQKDRYEVALVGQNLLGKHFEDWSVRVDRRVYGTFRLTY